MQLYTQKRKTKQEHQYTKHQQTITITNTGWYIISHLPNPGFWEVGTSSVIHLIQGFGDLNMIPLCGLGSPSRN